MASLPSSVTHEQLREFFAVLGFTDVKDVVGFEADLRTVTVRMTARDASGNPFVTGDGQVATNLITIPITRGA